MKKQKIMLAFCGLQCDTCPIFLATIEKDRSKQLEMRTSIARKCNELYNMQLQLGDVNDCYKCKSNERSLFTGCLKCEIRKCADGRGIESCAFCPDFACSVLEDHFLLDLSAKTRLTQIRELYYD
ncbi:MAG TPA: DUF3795 domain-containing protein [Draconibacterium sp.]|nr:DUF3795 domain-containing protein [Draconibacterium sp.]